MRIFKNKAFAKFTRQERISDKRLCEAVKNADAGKIDADYGGGVIKQRIARTGEGKSGGYRTVILYRRSHLAFFVYGYPKKDQANISRDDEKNFKAAAKEVLAFSDSDLDDFVQHRVFEEIKCDD